MTQNKFDVANEFIELKNKFHFAKMSKADEGTTKVLLSNLTYVEDKLSTISELGGETSEISSVKNIEAKECTITSVTV